MAGRGQGTAGEVGSQYFEIAVGKERERHINNQIGDPRHTGIVSQNLISHFVKVLVILLLCTLYIAVVEPVKQGEAGPWCTLLLWNTVTLTLHNFLHKPGHSHSGGHVIHTYMYMYCIHVHTYKVYYVILVSIYGPIQVRYSG